MKYENAKDVLPEKLLSEIQRFAAGKLLYVPSPLARRPWGVGTGYRRQLDERNEEIRRRFSAGDPIDLLADAFFLTPETVKKIVYRKKEKLQMEIREILKLYGNEAPVKIETVSEQPAYRRGDIEKPTGIYVEWAVEYPDRKMTVTVSDYAFAAPDRIEQNANAIEAYRRAGIAVCPRILNTLRGKRFAEVGYKGHDCTVFAAEYAEGTRPDGADTDGTPPYRDELLAAAAKIASLGLAGSEPCAYELFEPATACGRFADYTAEYVHGDLKNEITENYSALAEKYERIENLFDENRRALAAVWDGLPTSVFPGELSEGYFGEDGHVSVFRLCESGRERCVGHFIRLAFTLCTRRVANGCDETYDVGMRDRRLAEFRRDFAQLAKRYRFSEKEIQAAPLIYKNLLLGAYYYGGATDFAKGDEKRLSDFLDYLAKQLTENELDFPAILQK